MTEEEFIRRHNTVTERYGNKFCAAPWTSLHEGPSGLVSTCCKTRTPIGWSDKQTFEEMYNSEHIKSVRAEFLRGEQPAQCAECWTLEDHNGKASSNRMMSNRAGYDTIDELVAATDADGTLHKHLPTWLDLMWTNKCNFACLGCSPSVSTTIDAKYRDVFSVLHNVDYPAVGTWDNKNSSKIDYIIKHSDTIEQIHINGGEPFMQEGVYELLDEMLKRGLHKKITIWSHTNGSITRGYKDRNLITDYLVHWGDRARITMSADAFGQQGSYIRYGFDEDRWMTVLDSLRDTYIKVSFQSCTNVFNMASIVETGERLYALTGENYSSKVTPWTTVPTDSRMLHVVPELSGQILHQTRKDLESADVHSAFRKTLNTAIDYAESNIGVTCEKSRALYNGINKLDQIRNTNFCETFPELIPLYAHLKNQYES